MENSLGLVTPPVTGPRINTRDCPSGAQVASSSVLGSSGRNSRGEPPSTEMTKILSPLPGSAPWKAICFASGDQRGMVAVKGGKVNCVLSLPSLLHFQRVLSG